MSLHLQVSPVDCVLARKAYRIPRHDAPIELFLDGNEGRPPEESICEALEKLGVEAMSRYPQEPALERWFAKRWGVAEDRVLLTAGGDDALDRICRCVLTKGRELIFPVPSFEMIARYAEVAGGEVRRVPWPAEADYPLTEVCEMVSERTRLIAVVTPNNPTGTIAALDDIRKLASAAPHALILADLAYAEFAEEDPTPELLALPNVVVVRTLSKAWGLAGLRVGYVLAHPEVIRWLRIVGAPFSISSASLALAEKRLQEDAEKMKDYVSQVREERIQLQEWLAALGCEVHPGQGNFLLVRPPDALWFWEGLAGMGIAVRGYPKDPDLEQHIRLTCPGSPEKLKLLHHGLQTLMAPEAFLFDMDGVLADVSASYRVAILETAATFGVKLSAEDVNEAKDRGDANNDWLLTRRLLEERGVVVSQEEVTERFEALYQGTEGQPGLRAQERLLVSASWLRALAKLRPLGVVTGRPRRDARVLLEHFGLEDVFQAVVCMEDAPAKPSPAPVTLALQQLGVTRAWMFGDTPDDILAARGAGVLPIGHLAPGADAETTKAVLLRTGAARVISRLDEIDPWVEKLVQL